LIRLELSGTLPHRDIALRVISAACKLVNAKENDPETKEFRMQVVSAFGEAFNNIALHGYRGSPEGIIKIEIEVALGWMRIHLSDFGTSYDPTTVPAPDLDSLPESGLGLYIIRSFMDDVCYQPGSPNKLIMTKCLAQVGGGVANISEAKERG
jgi:serine/threonine-protein kinase RsbW